VANRQRKIIVRGATLWTTPLTLQISGVFLQTKELEPIDSIRRARRIIRHFPPLANLVRHWKVMA